MRVRVWQIAVLTGIVLPALGLSAGGASPAFTIIASTVGAGAAVALLLFPGMSVLLWAGTSVVLSVAILLLHAYVRDLVGVLDVRSYLTTLSICSLAIGSLASFLLHRWRPGGNLVLTSRSDIILLAALPVLASVLLVNSSNGYVQVPGKGEEFHARGYVNGDTMTLFALTRATEERARNPLDPSPGSGVLRANPFAGNGPLEYPTLVHRTLADIMLTTGGDITRAAWWLILPALMGTVAVSALSAQYIFRGQPLPLWLPLVLLAAYGSTWESFTFPQSHTFLTGVFFLLVLNLVARDQATAPSRRALLAVAAGLLTLVLQFANAVLGTAAVVLAVLASLASLADRRLGRGERLVTVVGAAVLAGLFLRLPPGAGALGTLNIAYTAVPEFLAAGLLGLVVLWALWDTAWLHRSGSLLVAGVALPILGLATLIFSARDLVAANAARFLFLLVLIGWPVVIPLIQRVADWWWREFRHVEHTPSEQFLLAGGVLVTAAILLLPSASSVARTLDELVRKPAHVISADELHAFAWMRTHTAPDAAFIRAPESLFNRQEVAPLSLPAFSGRAQLRSEYWLSPDDGLLEYLRLFLAGQANAPAGAQFLFCGPEISVCPSAGVIASTAGPVTIRALSPR